MKDYKKLEKAMEFARLKHKDQLDDEGKPYYEAHVKPVMMLTMLLSDDVELIMAAVLHDTIEDTNTTEKELEDLFGTRVKDIVMELTHEKGENGYYFPRLKTADAIMIKLLDRASNVSRMNAWDEKRRKQYLNKTDKLFLKSRYITEDQIEKYFQSWKDIGEYTESKGKATDYVGRIYTDLKKQLNEKSQHL